MSTDKILKIYRTSDLVPEIVPAPMTRPWMDATTKGFANRCLPLRIACGNGWHVRNFVDFAATWNGGDRPGDVEIVSNHPDIKHYVNGHFGYGTLTFVSHFLVRTPPGDDLFVTGPLNEFRDGVEPMAAIIESDWMHMSFTMNWKFTRPETPTYFMRGDVYMQMFVIPRGYGEDYKVTMENFEDNPNEQAYRDWSASRDNFHRQIREGEIDAHKRGWQGDYTKGARRKNTRFQGMSDED